MKKIINNKKYDTETARCVGSNSYSYPRDFNWFEETLYCKRTGEYFLLGEGGPASKYAERVEQNSWSGGKQLIPLSFESAQKWAEENLTADDYETEFGAVTEDETAVTLSISLPATLLAKLKRKAQETGSSVSGLITAMAEHDLSQA